MARPSAGGNFWTTFFLTDSNEARILPRSEDRSCSGGAGALALGTLALVTFLSLGNVALVFLVRDTAVRLRADHDG